MSKELSKSEQTLAIFIVYLNNVKEVVEGDI